MVPVAAAFLWKADEDVIVLGMGCHAELLLDWSFSMSVPSSIVDIVIPGWSLGLYLVLGSHYQENFLLHLLVESSTQEHILCMLP